VERLMEYEIMKDTVKHGLNMAYSLRDRIHILRFCSNLSQYSDVYRHQFLRAGGGVWVAQLGTEIIEK
jgi:hypothetical protein